MTWCLSFNSPETGPLVKVAEEEETELCVEEFMKLSGPCSFGHCFSSLLTLQQGGLPATLPLMV